MCRTVFGMWLNKTVWVTESFHIFIKKPGELGNILHITSEQIEAVMKNMHQV